MNEVNNTFIEILSLFSVFFIRESKNFIYKSCYFQAKNS